MATRSSREGICRLVKTGTLELEGKASHTPYFSGMVVIEDKLLVIDDDACNLQLYNRHDGTLISTSHRLESRPYGVCLINKTKVGVCLSNCTIKMLPLKSIDDKKLVKTINVRTRFDRCYSVAKLNSDIFIVSGWKYDGMFCWGVVSITDGFLDSTHDICKGDIGRTHLAINGNTIYISCLTSDSITTGVYAYDVYTPHKQKFMYKHQELEEPGSIMADRDCVYVCYYDSIHQLTDSGELLTIHKLPTILEGIYYDDQHGLLYTTSYRCNVITVYKMEYQSGIPAEILKMDERAIHLFEESLKDGKETVHSIRIIVVGHMGVGKTTLVKRLLGEKVNISERHSTEGLDVHVSSCDVSLSTHEWTRRTKDSDQDYQLWRLIKILNQNYKTRDSVADSEQSANLIKSMSHNADEDNTTEVTRYNRSQEQNYGHIILSTASQQEESHYTVVPGSELGENVAIENYKMDPLRDMLKLLQQNPNKAKQDVTKYAHLKIVDFAGQNVFYSTLQMFLTRRAIYLLVSDASRGLTDSVKVQVWMNSIHSCALPDKENLNSANSQTSSYKVIPPPVILVGTHIDQIPQGYQREHGQRYLEKIRSYLKDKLTAVHLVDMDFAIDNNSVPDSKLEELKKKIVEVASQQPYWGEQIPTRWFLLEQQLMRLRDAGVKIVSYNTVEHLNKQGTVQIEESEELDLFLKYLHETGTIIYFSIYILREYVVLEPKWLIYALKSLINAYQNLPNNPVDSEAESYAAQSDITQKWSDFKEKGILTVELVDAIWTKEKHPDLHEHKEHILMIMEQLNILVKPILFHDMGKMVKDYFLTPCMLRQEYPKDVISPEEDPHMLRTTEMRCIFTAKYLPTHIFHRLLAACVAYWPVAKKKKDTSENLIFCCCCVFDLDLFHRLTVYIKDHVVVARVTRMVVDDIEMPDPKLCSRVRRSITTNLSRITSNLGLNLPYELQASFQTWHAYEGHDDDATITPEHMNYVHLCVVLINICGRALRRILLTNFPVPYADIYQAILANRQRLAMRPRRPLLNNDQIMLLFPDPLGNRVGTVDQFDISLLYILIRNVSTVPAPVTGWNKDPCDQPRDTSLGASVERIRSYRNHISGHGAEGKISRQGLDDYWSKFEAVIRDIEVVLCEHVCSQELMKLRRKVFSFYELY